MPTKTADDDLGVTERDGSTIVMPNVSTDDDDADEAELDGSTIVVLPTKTTDDVVG